MADTTLDITVDQITYNSQTGKLETVTALRAAPNVPLGLFASEFKPEIAYLTALCEIHLHQSCYQDSLVIHIAMEKCLTNNNFAPFDMCKLKDRGATSFRRNKIPASPEVKSFLIPCVTNMLKEFRKQRQLAESGSERVYVFRGEKIGGVDNSAEIATQSAERSQHTGMPMDKSTKKTVTIYDDNVRVALKIGKGESVIVRKMKRDQ